MKFKDYIENTDSIHFAGIGGVSMSSLAEIMLSRGYKITGSDVARSYNTNRLEKLGVKITYEHCAENMTDAKLVIYSNAIKEYNIERTEAARLGVPCFERSALMGYLMSSYDFAVCVAGTHGKTTTTSMISQIAMDAGLDPTILNGGTLDSIGGSYRIGKNSHLLVAEACEYYDSFLKFNPKIAVITNVEYDHVDYFKTFEHYKESFKKFALLTPKDGGVLILNGDDAEIRKLYSDIDRKKYFYSLRDSSCDFYAQNITYGKNGNPEFDIYMRGELLCHVALCVGGDHNVYNAVAAAAAATVFGIEGDDIKKSLEGFVNAKRRFEIRGYYNGAAIIDDYAHHPNEIKTALKTAKNAGYKRVIAVFQPHTFSRTEALFDDFVKSFDDADITVIADICPAREKFRDDIHAKEFEGKIPRSIYKGSFENISDYCKEIARDGDAIITLSCGDINKVCSLILEGKD